VGDPVRRFEVAMVHRNPWVLGAASAPYLLCALAVLGAITQRNLGMLWLIVHGVLFGSIAVFTAWRRNLWPRQEETELRLEGDALWLGDRRFDRDEIVGGFTVPGGTGVTVRLRLRGARPDLELGMRSEAQAAALLCALGLGPKDRVASFRTMSLVHGRTWWAAALVVAACVLALGLGSVLERVVGGTATSSLMVAMLLMSGAVTLVPARVEVGADGVLIRWLGRNRFVRHDEIDIAIATERRWGRSRRTAVLLTLNTNEEIDIPVAPLTWDGGRAAALAARIEEAMQAHRAGTAAPEALLHRGDRDHAAWVRALRSTVELATHRRAVPTGEQLWRIIEDPAGESLTRAAAAVALGGQLGGSQLGEKERARLVRIAGSTAAPRLRVALDALLEGEDDEAVGEALEALEKERGVSRRKAT
jgi:hypothetical protein